MKAPDIRTTLRTQGPLLHYITKFVTMDAAVSVPLAAGASIAPVNAVDAAITNVTSAIESANIVSVGTGCGPTHHFTRFYD